MENPSSGESSGRTPSGKFQKGNKIGVGNPFAKRAMAIRAALFRAATPEKIKKACEALMDQAAGGDRFAFAEVMDRLTGKSVPMDFEEKISQLEAMVEKLINEKSGPG